MPVVDGLETTQALKQMFDTFNRKISDRGGHTTVLRPLIIHLTQYDNDFKQFIRREEQADLYLQKPISRKDLWTLLKMLKLI